eukprot:Hpha_TRINITY_DN16733_c1_g2::TRINITY_DN16733_c1_g2_i5::g.80323::m.80323
MKIRAHWKAKTKSITDTDMEELHKMSDEEVYEDLLRLMQARAAKLEGRKDDFISTLQRAPGGTAGEGGFEGLFSRGRHRCAPLRPKDEADEDPQRQPHPDDEFAVKALNGSKQLCELVGEENMQRLRRCREDEREFMIRKLGGMFMQVLYDEVAGPSQAAGQAQTVGERGSGASGGAARKQRG